MADAIAYPDEATVEAIQDQLLAEAIEEMKSTSNGIIKNILPRYESEGWQITAVVVSDAWYNSAAHEKERFAEQVGEAVEKLIKGAGKVKSDEVVGVYFLDSYGKELASPKILGGYKILR